MILDQLKILGIRKIIFLIFLMLTAIQLGWGVVKYYLHTPESASDSCLAEEKEIRDWLSANNHCETQSDCLAISLNCPFGCNQYIHKDVDFVPIKEKVAYYNTQCGFCVEECSNQPPACINHQCVTPDSLLQ